MPDHQTVSVLSLQHNFNGILHVKQGECEKVTPKTCMKFYITVKQSDFTINFLLK